MTGNQFKPSAGGYPRRKTLMPKGTPFDLTGIRFTKLVAIRLHGTNHNKHRVWECLCDCGKTVYPTAQGLYSGKTKSCGCWRPERPAKHGFTRRTARVSSTYYCWTAMRDRCNNANNPAYTTFGGRGIKVCDRWDEFPNFLTDMGERPQGLQIERIDKDGNFQPGNCKWATVSEKGFNKRTNTKYTVRSITKSFGQWAEHLGIERSTLWERMQKWPLEKALTTPPWRPTERLAQPKYGSNWYRARNAAMKRSGGICQRCKKAKAVHVHHRMPARYFKKPEDANFADNLMAVCHRCHTKEHKEMEAKFPLLDIIPFEKTARRSRRDIRRWITWRGHTKTLTEWARLIPDKRFPVQFLGKRLRVYPLDKAMEPLNDIVRNVS